MRRRSHVSPMYTPPAYLRMRAWNVRSGAPIPPRCALADASVRAYVCSCHTARAAQGERRAAMSTALARVGLARTRAARVRAPSRARPRAAATSDGVAGAADADAGAGAGAGGGNPPPPLLERSPEEIGATMLRAALGVTAVARDAVERPAELEARVTEAADSLAEALQRPGDPAERAVAALGVAAAQVDALAARADEAEGGLAELAAGLPGLSELEGLGGAVEAAFEQGTRTGASMRAFGRPGRGAVQLVGPGCVRARARARVRARVVQCSAAVDPA